MTNNRYNNLEYIIKANRVHNNFYNYSLVKYKGSKSKIKIICPIHGIFKQNAGHHLNGRGCRKCYDLLSKHNKSNTNTFILNSKLIHKNKYDYSLVNYINAHTKVKIICSKHGIFEQKPNNHLNGRGCPKCGAEFIPLIAKSSNGELELLNFIKSIYKGKILTNIRTIISPLELDIYLPELNIAIEYNGNYWHSDKFKNKNYHNNKYNQCLDKNIKLLSIFEDEWINKKQLIKFKIKKCLNLINYSNYDIIIKPVDSQTAFKFNTKYNLEKNIKITYNNLGLYHNNILLSLISIYDNILLYYSTINHIRIYNDFILLLINYKNYSNLKIKFNKRLLNFDEVNNLILLESGEPTLYPIKSYNIWDCGFNIYKFNEYSNIF